MQKDSLVKGTAVLGTSLLIAKVFGLVYRLVLPNLIGTQAMGLYGMAYAVYTVLLTLSMAGIPVAISKLISKDIATGDYSNALRVFKIAFMTMAVTGVVFSTLLFFGSTYISEHVTGDPRAYLSLRAVAPAILIVSLMSSFRGYFQGLQKMTNTAISQLLEQFIRVFGIILFAYIMLPHGEVYAAAGAAFGNVGGAFAGLIYLWWRYYKTPMPTVTQPVSGLSVEKQIQVVKQIFYLAFPIIIGNLVMPIMNLIDATVVVNRLTLSGFSQDEATGMFAHLTQYANPIIMFPATVGMALAMSLVPAISETVAKRELAKTRFRAKTALRFSILFGLPSFLGLFLLSQQVIDLIFPRDPEASIPLLYLSPGIVFLMIKFATTGILQGLGKTMVPVKNLFIGAIFKVVITFWLTSIPGLNIRGAAIGTLIAYIIATLLNLNQVQKHVGVKFSKKEDLIKPLFATAIMGFLVMISYNFFAGLLTQNLGTLISIVVGVVVYGAVVLGLRIVTPEELMFIPKVGPKIARILR